MQRSISSVDCELIYNDYLNKDIFRLVFIWQGKDNKKLPAPLAGQFYMIKPKRTGFFLGRPISVYSTGKFEEHNSITFLIAQRGRGTQELADMRSGEEAELTGPLGNAWMDFLPPVTKSEKKPIALIGGGIGIAPLNGLLCESTGHAFDFYIGLKNGFENDDAKRAFLGPAVHAAEKMIIATEDGKTGHKGLIPDFLEPEKYAAVCACGPEPMLKAVAAKCNAAGVPCFVSLERRMACGVGACLGCTVKTVNGNRRCCADGPIFNANEVVFSE